MYRVTIEQWDDDGQKRIKNAHYADLPDATIEALLSIGWGRMDHLAAEIVSAFAERDQYRNSFELDGLTEAVEEMCVGADKVLEIWAKHDEERDKLYADAGPAAG